ncbi:MAG: hypothetical protein QG620_337 [Patescibacteria group bacterium]|nr:hypothetical protein [Patescibacteria group bacterium]
MEIMLSEDLAGCRVEMWFELSLSTGETGSEVAGYFTDKDLATEKGRGKGFFGADGYVEPVFVLTRDGKTGYLIGKEIRLDDEAKTIESVRERALKKLTAEEIRILGLDKERCGESVKSINTGQKCSCGFEECPHCGDEY